MRLTIKKSVYKSIGIWNFILLLIFKVILPQPAFALLSFLGTCAVKPKCDPALVSKLSHTAEAVRTTEISTTTLIGATTSSVEAVARTTVIEDMRLPAIASFYIWKQAENQAKEKYCSFYPLNLVCGPQGQSSVLYNYKFHETVHYRRSDYPDKFVTNHYRSWRPAPGAIRSLANQYPGRYFGGSDTPSGDYVFWIKLNDGDGNNKTRGVVYEYSTGDTMTWDDYANYSNNNVEGGWISDVVRADTVPDNLPPRDRKD
ncbi:hypothetical protein [Nostoc sp.]|uniref:hypothetical protein n=1 Tax=Nostoc sp. TaxID=1180 RepID=UPI002FF679A1